MNPQDIQNLIKGLEPFLEQKIKENSYLVNQSTKKENSDLVFPLKEIMEQRFDEQNSHLIEIKEQVKKTNGRVNSLELSRSYLWGAVAVLLLLGGGIAGLFWSVLEAKIEKAVEQALLDKINKVEYEK